MRLDLDMAGRPQEFTHKTETVLETNFFKGILNYFQVLHISSLLFDFISQDILMENILIYPFLSSIIIRAFCV